MTRYECCIHDGNGVACNRKAEYRVWYQGCGGIYTYLCDYHACEALHCSNAYQVVKINVPAENGLGPVEEKIIVNYRECPECHKEMDRWAREWWLNGVNLRVVGLACNRCKEYCILDVSPVMAEDDKNKYGMICPHCKEII